VLGGQANIEVLQRGDGFLERQADDVAARADDAGDDRAASPLRGVAACFVERVDGGEILFDHSIAQFFEHNPGKDGEGE